MTGCRSSRRRGSWRRSRRSDLRVVPGGGETGEGGGEEAGEGRGEGRREGRRDGRWEGGREGGGGGGDGRDGCRGGGGGGGGGGAVECVISAHRAKAPYEPKGCNQQLINVLTIWLINQPSGAVRARSRGARSRSGGRRVRVYPRARPRRRLGTRLPEIARDCPRLGAAAVGMKTALLRREITRDCPRLGAAAVGMKTALLRRERTGPAGGSSSRLPLP